MKYLGATLLGNVIGAIAGMSFTAIIPIIVFINTGGALSIGITGSVTLTFLGAQVFTGVGLAGIIIMMSSNNRPGNNKKQNKQYLDAAREAGLDIKKPYVRDQLNEIHRYIRKNKLNFGWKDIIKFIKEWFF